MISSMFVSARSAYFVYHPFYLNVTFSLTANDDQDEGFVRR